MQINIGQNYYIVEVIIYIYIFIILVNLIFESCLGVIKVYILWGVVKALMSCTCIYVFRASVDKTAKLVTWQ